MSTSRHEHESILFCFGFFFFWKAAQAKKPRFIASIDADGLLSLIFFFALVFVVVVHMCVFSAFFDGRPGVFQHFFLFSFDLDNINSSAGAAATAAAIKCFFFFFLSFRLADKNVVLIQLFIHIVDACSLHTGTQSSNERTHGTHNPHRSFA